MCADRSDLVFLTGRSADKVYLPRMWLLVHSQSDTFAIEVSGEETINELRSILGTDHGYGGDFILAHGANAFSPSDHRTIRSAGLTNMAVLSIQQASSISRPEHPPPAAIATAPPPPPPPAKPKKAQGPMLEPATLLPNAKGPASSRRRRPTPTAAASPEEATPSPAATPESTMTGTPNVVAPRRPARRTRCCTVA